MEDTVHTPWMFHADPWHSGINDDGGTRPANIQKWMVPTGDRVYSSPAVVDCVVYIGSDDNKVYALDSVTGAQVWNYTTGGRVVAGPAVINGVVYIGSYDKNLYALDQLTGTKLWSFKTGGWVTSSPVVTGGVVYSGSLNDKLYAINAVTGVEIWNATFGKYPSIDSSPAVADGVLYVTGGYNTMYALDSSTGAIRWNFTRGAPLYASPSVAGNTVYQGSHDHNLYALNASSGEVRWNYTAGDTIGTCPAVANGLVYFGSNDNNVYALDALTGAKVWSYTTGGAVDSDPTVANGVVYVGSFDYNVYALDALTGTKLWSFPTGSVVFSSPAVANGLVYFGNLDGRVYAVGSAPAAANLMIGKSAPRFQENASTMNYTLPYRNQGNIAAENVILKDYLPPGVEFVSATGFTVYDLTNRIVTWHLGSLSPGSAGSQTITVRIPSSLPYDTVLNNIANITTTTKETRYDDNFASAQTTLKQAWVPPGVSVSPSIPSPWGSACVDWRSQVLITYNQSYCPEGTPVTIRIKIDDGGPDITGPMTGGPRLWNYSTTFYPRYGAGTISLVNEGECSISGMTFPIYIEPAGYIYDTSSGMRLQGANAYLQWPDEEGNWVNVPTGLLNPPMQPDQNPQVTNSAGQYQWDVVEGSYRVYVEASGYKPNASTMVNSPPAISGLIIGLEPTNGNLGVGSTPAGAQIYLDGSNTGFITPYTLAGISAGQHSVLLTRAGYQDYNQTVTVTAGKTTIMRATLEPVSPVAAFNASPRAGTYPLSVQFTDNSSGLPPIAYQWSFGDGSSINTERSPVHVYQSAGKFSVNLTVTNSAGNSTLARPDYIEVSAPQPSEYNLVLGEGWNLVSVPKKLAPGYDTGSIFNNVTTEGRTIWEYEAVINNWIPVYTDTPVLPLYGFWIYSKYPTTVPLKFDPNPLQVPPSRELAKGWELIGFSGTIPASARDTLISVRNNWTQAMGFNTTLYQYDIQVINGGSGQFSDERLMHPSKGYWLFMTGPGDLSAIGV